MSNNTEIPVMVRAALLRGDTIEAIKLLRNVKGLGLKEAKDIIDLQSRGSPKPVQPALLRRAPTMSSPDALPHTVSSALHSGNKVEAIRLLRQHSGMDLKNATDTIESSQHNEYMLNPNLSPGKVSGSGGFVGWVVATVIAGIVAYYFLRG